LLIKCVRTVRQQSGRTVREMKIKVHCVDYIFVVYKCTMYVVDDLIVAGNPG